MIWRILLIHCFAATLAQAKTWSAEDIHLENSLRLLPGQLNPVTVAIVDTGMDSSHLELQQMLWTNPGEIPGNGIDDDHNGYVDDIHGWNFVDNNNDLADSHGHGTHISGIIQQVAPQAKLMILKYYDPRLSIEKNIANTIAAFRYAIHMHAQIINFSAGGTGFNAQEFATLQEASEKNILLVAAAGNDGSNTDINRYYPADYGLTNILSVTAIDQNGQLPWYANWGKKTVDLAAPGDVIISTLPHGRKGELSGTSQATAFVTGVAALLKMRDPAIHASELGETIKASVSPLRKIATKSSGKLNAYQALVMRGRYSTVTGLRLANGAAMNQDLFTIRPSR